MTSRGRLPFPAGFLLSIAAIAGCTTEQSNHSAGSFPWISQSDAPGTRRELKNASQLDLSYAQWQEQLGNLPEAEESYKRVLQDDPDSVAAMIGLARLEQLAGRKDSAEQAYQRAAKSAPAGGHALDALGQFYASETRWREAAAAHARATQAAPTNAVYRQHYAVALARHGDVSGALAQFKLAVGEAEGHYNIGYILYEQGRTDLAEQQFLQAVTLRPDLEAAQTMLDELHRRGGDEATFAQNLRSTDEVVQTSAAELPGPERHEPSAAATPSRAYHPPQWQMPTDASAASLQAEQSRNQVCPTARP